jgi:CDP-diacylglycerol---serine O-phosphatidyltransferase
LKKLRDFLPNIITLTNLSLGVLAILLAVSSDQYSHKHYIFYASLLVMLAALTDRLDGKVARMLDATSDLGKELDSLSDLISFGLAPVIIAWKICLFKLGIVGYLVCLIFPIGGAYRLARYNITKFDNVFSGLPITIAGAFLTINNMWIIYTKLKAPHIIITPLLIILLSFLMVSKIKLRKV